MCVWGGGTHLSTNAYEFYDRNGVSVKESGILSSDKKKYMLNN